MRIGGLQKTTLIDFPGKIAATIFTIGCPFRCLYCHNPELVVPDRFCSEIPIETVMHFLEKRAHQLEGLCISGGEPTVHSDLQQFISRVKGLGYLIKLDTNGVNPHVLKNIFQDKTVDYIAMDIKSPINRYSEIIVTKNIEEKIQQSIQLIMNSGIDYEFRTTTAKPLLSIKDFKGIGSLINGAKRHYIQNYVKASKQVNLTKPLEPFTKDELLKSQAILKKYVKKVQIRL